MSFKVKVCEINPYWFKLRKTNFKDKLICKFRRTRMDSDTFKPYDDLLDSCNPPDVVRVAPEETSIMILTPTNYLRETKDVNEFRKLYFRGGRGYQYRPLGPVDASGQNMVALMMSSRLVRSVVQQKYMDSCIHITQEFRAQLARKLYHYIRALIRTTVSYCEGDLRKTSTGLDVLHAVSFLRRRPRRVGPISFEEADEGKDLDYVQGDEPSSEDISSEDDPSDSDDDYTDHSDSDDEYDTLVADAEDFEQGPSSRRSAEDFDGPAPLNWR